MVAMIAMVDMVIMVEFGGNIILIVDFHSLITRSFFYEVVEWSKTFDLFIINTSIL